MQKFMRLSLVASMSALAVGAIDLHAANAADMAVPQAQAPTYYSQPPAEESYAYPPPPPVMYGYPPPPPPVAYYEYAEPPVAVLSGPYYAGGPYWRGYGYGPHFAYGYGYGRWGRGYRR